MTTFDLDLPLGLDVPSLLAAYGDGGTRGGLDPLAVVEALLARREAAGTEGIWISVVPAEELRARARALVARRAAGASLPLYGVPFAVKDNLDVAGMKTTAGCPAFAYEATETAPVVARLEAAGALLFGKTNLDQFATGLVGVRSPYGVPANPFDARYVVGGSSSGSAAAVARGLVSFALGTDTAGSGRVPAAFTGTVGVKPSRGLLSTRGLVPACRSLDCVSIFARSCAGARSVAEVATAFDAEDPYARPEADGFSWREAVPAPLRVGIPLPEDRRFFGDAAAEARFAAAEARLADLGAALVPVPMGPFFEAAALLYEGPFIAERLAGLEPFVGAQPEALLPVTRAILERGALPRGTEVFAALHRLEALKALARAVFRTIDALLVPTTPTIYRVDEILADPVRLNARLGTYTNFVNLLDLAAIAVPNGLRPDGLPSGVTFVGPWGSDARLAAIGALFTAEIRGEAPAEGAMELAVVGAHLSGEPLNGELVRLGARLVRAGRTAPRYRLFALPGTSPEKPGLLRVDAGGAPIEVEVWALPPAALGRFFAGVAAPLSIGRVELEDGARVAGFLCEAHATTGARDISSFGGWRAYRRAAAS